MEHGVNKYSHNDLQQLEEKIEYIYNFCQQFEEVMHAIAQSPMAKMMPGMPKEFKVNSNGST